MRLRLSREILISLPALTRRITPETASGLHSLKQSEENDILNVLKPLKTESVLIEFPHHHQVLRPANDFDQGFDGVVRLYPFQSFLDRASHAFEYAKPLLIDLDTKCPKYCDWKITDRGSAYWAAVGG